MMVRRGEVALVYLLLHPPSNCMHASMLQPPEHLDLQAVRGVAHEERKTVGTDLDGMACEMGANHVIVYTT